MSDPIQRRQFLKLGTGTAIAGFNLGFQRVAQASDPTGDLYQRIIPARKEMDAAWAGSLVRRGGGMDAGISSSSKADLARIGMTVGGIGCGTVYLTGDGRLFVWDIFHQPHEGVVAHTVDVPAGLQNIAGAGKRVRERDGSNYIVPPTPDTHPNPFRQGFALSIGAGGEARAMDHTGWEKISFTGRWPLGIVKFSDPACPISCRLEAWTPFIPLETADSSLPVTVMEYTLTNPTQEEVRGTFTGIWENPVGVFTRRKNPLNLRSEIIQEHGATHLFHRADRTEAPGLAPREDVVSEDRGSTEADVTSAGDFGTAVLSLLDGEVPNEGGNPDHLATSFAIPAGGSRVIRFVLSWHFPNMRKLPGLPKPSPLHCKRYTDAAVVARDVAKRMPALRRGTMAWVKTWNDSTLPQWLLDRSILTTNTLQTTNCHVLADGRFWAWEGIGCCAGTCAHVWHYAQGVARLFPDLERNLREVTDFGIAMKPDGSIRFRAEANDMAAIDSQTGIVLRTWREHLVSADDGFLRRIWPGAKRALEWLIRFDENGRGGLDGLLDGKQHNTLDAEWYGKVHCLCSLYLAALRAGEEMASRMGDASFAASCKGTHRMGAEKISSLFNGEFYIQEEDPAHSKAIGVGAGCYIDQVIGQWWATQTGLGRIYDETHIRTALHSLWRYNFVPEVGNFRRVFTQGRFYAMPGEAGLIMCTWPKGGLREDFKKHWQYAYFNECMSGFEWQAAAHMVQEGSAVDDDVADEAAALLDNPQDPRSLTLRGLAVGRAVHDRYAPSLRNPYNEIECSDHYARANASYSLFLAACGFSYNGPAGEMGFAPKIQPKNFRCAFTAAQGWGSFEQKQRPENAWSAELEIVRGELILNTLELPWLGPRATAMLGDKIVECEASEGRVRFKNPIQLKADGEKLKISQP